MEREALAERDDCGGAASRSAEASRSTVVGNYGGQIFMPMQETFFALRFSMPRDRFGTSWMILNGRPLSAPL
jgi:PhnB protein